MKFKALLIAVAAGSIAAPAIAQDRDPAEDFNGPYIGVVGGASLQPSDRNESLLFDTDLDGNYGDTVNTATGANAFSPGFCGGRATSSAPTSGCRNDVDGAEYYLRLGTDHRMGNFVVGALIEGGRSEAKDSVTGFSTTPAYYELTRRADYQAGARLRAGYTPGGGALFYVTGGGAYARMKNSFTTSNTANSFTDTGKSNAWGYSVGGGAEVMVTNGLSLGLEYLYTDLKDNDYRVEVGQGTAPDTNPFLLDAGGTNIVRSSPSFKTHSVRGTLSYRF